MEYRFTGSDGQILKFDSSAEGTERLFCDRYTAGRDNTRWVEIYQTPHDRYVRLSCTLWQGESEHVELVGEAEVAHTLSLADYEHISTAGQAFLAEHDLAVEA